MMQIPLTITYTHPAPTKYVIALNQADFRWRASKIGKGSYTALMLPSPDVLTSVPFFLHYGRGALGLNYINKTLLSHVGPDAAFLVHTKLPLTSLCMCGCARDAVFGL